MMISPPILEQLQEIAGPGGSLHDPQLIAPYLVDHRKLYRGNTPLK